MPRQTRRLPRRINRFNYYGYTFTYPERADLQPTPVGELNRAGHEEMRRRFIRHLAGPCGASGCVADRDIARNPGARNRIALAYYIETDSLWQQDVDAQQVLKALSAAHRGRLLRLDERKWRQRRLALDRLLAVIERDQRIFKEMLRQVEAGQLRPSNLREERSVELTGAFVSGLTAYRIWREYHAQGSRLLGKAARPPRAYRAWSARFRKKASGGAVLVEVTSPDGRRLRVFKPAGSTSTTSNGSVARRDLQPVCRNWGEAVEWFEQALRNLKRWRQGRPPLLWRPVR